jgi:hypothetical protein
LDGANRLLAHLDRIQVLEETSEFLPEGEALVQRATAEDIVRIIRSMLDSQGRWFTLRKATGEAIENLRRRLGY